MKLPTKIKGRNKIRDAKICYSWIEDLQTFPEIAEKFHLTERRVRQILVLNHSYLPIDKEWEKKKRIHLLNTSIKNSKESTKDRADLLEQLRKEIEGDKPSIDNSKHLYLTTVIQQIHALENKDNGSNTTNRIQAETLAE